MEVTDGSTDEGFPVFKFQGRKNLRSLLDFRQLLPVIRSLKRVAEAKEKPGLKRVAGSRLSFFYQSVQGASLKRSGNATMIIYPVLDTGMPFALWPL